MGEKGLVQKRVRNKYSALDRSDMHVFHARERSPGTNQLTGTIIRNILMGRE